MPRWPVRASEVLRKIIPDVLDAQHAARCRVLLRAVDALAEGGRLPLMDLARSARGYTHVWAPLKAFDRLLSNRHLWAEHSALYQALNAPWEDRRRPVLVVDWSDTKADRSIHLLRAARPVGSRALPVLDRVFGATEQQTAKAHAQFLAQLRRMMPDGAKPILICDAGFGVRWFRQAQAAGFAVIARLRGVSHVAPVGSDAFVALTTLHDGATATPEDLGHFHITQQHREPLRLIRVRLDDRHRRKLTAAHKPARRNDCARANAEPWLLSVSPALDDLCAHDIVRLYAQRMQIEESFRDLKNERFGHALCHSQTRQAQRMLMLILLDTLASYAAFWLGILARQHTAHRRLFPHRQAAKRSTPQLSIIRIGRELLRRHPAWRPPWPPDIQTLRAAQEALYA